jgi:transcriptional regulator with XRE-family HTH domain
VSAHVDFYRQLGRRIAALRRTVGLSQERLGERARIAASYVAHIEIGGRKPTIDVLLRIADAVDVPLWRLLTDDRLTTDEKAWDASARELALQVRGISQPDLQALTHLAARLQLISSTGPSVGPRALRAAESDASRWKPISRSSRKKPR